jgi:hypothetical protein
MKRKIRHISASGVIYKESNPREIFVEFRGTGYPVPAFQNSTCCLGGNWIGSDAAQDQQPLDTFLREIEAELSFEKPVQAQSELVQLGILDAVSHYRVKPCTKEPTSEDEGKLAALKAAIAKHVYYFGDTIQHIPEIVFARADPKNTRRGMVYLNVFFEVPLPTADWQALVELQEKFGNLSNESTTVITTVQKLLTDRQPCAWSYDYILKRFFMERGAFEARGMRLVPDIEVAWRLRGNHSYAKYLEHFDIEFHPLKQGL